MSTDLNALSYTELLDLQKQVQSAVDERRAEEGATAKKEWLASDAAKSLATRVAGLRKKFEKLSGRCSKAKSINLRIKLDVDMQPSDFDDVLQGTYDRSMCELFNVECGGTVQNKADCHGLIDEVQSRVDDIMGDVCEEAAGLHGKLKDDCDSFTEEYNELINDLRDAQSFGLTPAEIEETLTAPKKKAAKKSKKGKR